MHSTLDCPDVSSAITLTECESVPIVRAQRSEFKRHFSLAPLTSHTSNYSFPLQNEDRGDKARTRYTFVTLLITVEIDLTLINFVYFYAICSIPRRISQFD